jgi:hypothetical protein
MKSNFKSNRSQNNDQTTQNTENEDGDSNMSAKEFEEFVIKSGAAGSFMIFRSSKKDDELGIDEL